MIWTYVIIAVILVIAELCYFKIADYFNIIDKPNERSSHSKVVLRGGGIIFPIAILVWMGWEMVSSFRFQDSGALQTVQGYLPFVVGTLLVCGVSFWDDIHSLPDSLRLVAQFVGMAMLICPCIEDAPYPWELKMAAFIIGMIVCVGATNIYNFMDGINGITGGYSLAVLIPLMLVDTASSFVEPSFLVVATLAVLVFCIFNFRPKNKAKCFAGDVGSIGIAFILLFAIGRLVVQAGDVTWFVLLAVYGVDGCLTIIHRIMLHENLGKAHRKHAYQLMANELGMSHVTVSLIYMGLQLIISLGMVYLIPNTVAAHWAYLAGTVAILCIAYIAFMKKYYHLHEEYLNTLKK